jgi:hypothetical protein
MSRFSINILLGQAVRQAGLRGPDGELVRYTPHDFRRIFATEIVAGGLPVHIAAKILGHHSLAVTERYVAVYDQDVIDHHRAFIAQRRAARPSEEYRTPTEEEWDAFLAHFEKRKVSIGTCARSFGSPCVHEHACVRCSLLRPDPAQRARLEEIRDNLLARIAEAQREGWLGEVEGLQVSFAGAEDKLAQLDHRARTTVELGMPTVRLQSSPP